MNLKKKYISPSTETLYVRVESMLAGSDLQINTEHEGGYDQLGGGGNAWDIWETN
jgi:hypothetical protein